MGQPTKSDSCCEQRVQRSVPNSFRYTEFSAKEITQSWPLSLRMFRKVLQLQELRLTCLFNLSFCSPVAVMVRWTSADSSNRRRICLPFLFCFVLFCLVTATAKQCQQTCWLVRQCHKRACDSWIVSLLMRLRCLFFALDLSRRSRPIRILNSDEVYYHTTDAILHLAEHVCYNMEDWRERCCQPISWSNLQQHVRTLTVPTDCTVSCTVLETWDDTVPGSSQRIWFESQPHNTALIQSAPQVRSAACMHKPITHWDEKSC